jgi:hypothetical protein
MNTLTSTKDFYKEISNQHPQHGNIFAPGTLLMTPLESLQQGHFDQ